MAYWTCIGMGTFGIPWPDSEKKILFESHELVLRPETDILAPSIAFEHGSKGISPADGRTLVRRFMSALAWIEGLSVRETMCIGSSGPAGIGKSHFRGGGKSVVFDYPYVPTPSEPNKKLALAFTEKLSGIIVSSINFYGFNKDYQYCGRHKI